MYLCLEVHIISTSLQKLKKKKLKYTIIISDVV